MLGWSLNLGFAGSESGSNNGVLSATLADVVLSSTGTLELQGALSQSLAAVSLSSTGVLALSGSLAQTLAPVTLSSAATLALTGVLAATLQDIALNAEGSSGTTGASSVTLESFSLDSSATLTGTSESFSGGFLYAYEAQMAARRRRRRELEEREEEAQKLKSQVDREIALLLTQQEAKEDRAQELERLQNLVAIHSHRQLELSDRAKIAYVRAMTKATIGALEALDRELQRQIDDEDLAIILLLND